MTDDEKKRISDLLENIEELEEPLPEDTGVALKPANSKPGKEL